MSTTDRTSDDDLRRAWRQVCHGKSRANPTKADLDYKTKHLNVQTAADGELVFKGNERDQWIKVDPDATVDRQAAGNVLDDVDREDPEEL